MVAQRQNLKVLPEIARAGALDQNSDGPHRKTLSTWLAWLGRPRLGKYLADEPDGTGEVTDHRSGPESRDAWRGIGLRITHTSPDIQGRREN